ncbi:MAG: DUF3800 domain-containing protein [Nitrospirales bacterium]|nr:DUF3800 domain-containing protein [Nitrospirales bacterium]
MTKKYVLYFDDTGSRDPDKTDYPNRQDEMDCFGLGGFLLKEEDIPELRKKHQTFCEKWSINYPLHSQSIRGGRNQFGWLRQTPEKAFLFYSELNELLLDLPLIGIACVIDRPGYVARYKTKYPASLWYMCKTAFSILVERSAKFADEQARQLEIVFEGSGPKEDRDIKAYLRELKKIGNPFSQETSEGYTPLTAEDYRRIILGEPHQKSKKIPMLQIADLVLYPIAKGGYDRNYKPYKELLEGGKLIDKFFAEDHLLFRGIKYSCFDRQKD